VRAPPASFPNTHDLAIGLGEVLGDDVRVLDRSPAIWASTYPAEVVTCQLGGRDELKLYCKYLGGQVYNSFGHRGGLAYEVDVYRGVLNGLSLSLPRFYGAYEQPTTCDLWLVLEYLDQALRVTKGPQLQTVARAARWIGHFQAANEARISDPGTAFLRRYDSEYYLGWARRTLQFASEMDINLPWLAPLCMRFEECVAMLLSSPATIIHGEFYPHNVLMRGTEIYPIDWESAAIGAGEIDLATLTEDWSPECIRQCDQAYRQARWNKATPAGFDDRLAAARLYLCFRWMGEQPEWTLDSANHSYFDQMRALGELLGLI